jgi:predicted enzyme related to lactoylglutathione lyase
VTVRDSYAPGTPCWVDLGTPDVPGSVAFYRGLFDWGSGPADAEHGGYTVLTLDSVEVAGAGPIGGSGFGPSWGVYLSVADAEATAAAVRAAGGDVAFAPRDIGGGGRMAVLLDNAGAAVHVWQPRSFPGARVTHVPGALTWVVINSRDFDATAAFYGEVFGWTCRLVPMGFGPYGVFSLDGRDVAGMTAMAPGMPPEPASFWTPYFEVDDPDRTADRCADLGGRVLQDAIDIDPGRFAVLADQVGATFGIIRGRSGDESPPPPTS